MARKISQDSSFTQPWADVEFAKVLRGCRTTRTSVFEKRFYEASVVAHRIETILRAEENPMRYAGKKFSLKINFYRKEERRQLYDFIVLFSTDGNDIYGIDSESTMALPT